MKKSRFLHALRLALTNCIVPGLVMGDGPMVPPGAPPVPPARLSDFADYDSIQNREAAAFLYSRKLLKAVKMEEGFRFAPEAAADLKALSEAVRSLLPDFRFEPDALLTRDEAAGLYYAAMQEQGLILMDSSAVYTDYTVPAGSLIAARPGKQVTLTVNGVETAIVPGTRYTGDVRFSVTDSYEITHMFDVYEGRTAICIRNGLDESRSVAAAVQSGVISDTRLENPVIISRNDYFNPIILDGDGSCTVINPQITMEGHGGDDFAGYGAGIMVTGNCQAVIDGGQIDTTGSIRTAVWLGGHSHTLVKNLTITGHDGPTTDFPVSVMNQVPWPLGLSGNLRTTNLLEWAEGTYLNCSVSCEQWGVMSTDGSWRGSKLTCINTDARITGKSGYGAYCDMGVEDYFYGTGLTVPDYGVIIGGGFCGATFGPASRENTGDLYSQIPQARQDAPTVVEAGRHAVMIHSNQGGHCTVQPGTVFHSGGAVILVKSMAGKEVTTRIEIDGAELCSDSGVLLHMMESDDAGSPGADGLEIPVVCPVKTDLDTTDTEEATNLHACFSNMTLQGSCYNSRWTGGQNLCLHFDHCTLTGALTAAVQHHTNLAPGGFLTPDLRHEVGNVSVTPAPVVSNGVIVLLQDSVWIPNGISYISCLELDAGSQLYGQLTVDGASVTPEAGKRYTGNLVVTPLEYK